MPHIIGGNNDDERKGTEYQQTIDAKREINNCWKGKIIKFDQLIIMLNLIMS